MTTTAPAGAFPNGATVTLTIVPASSLPSAVARTIKSAPSGQLVAFTVDAGSATLAAPLSASVNIAAPAGLTPRLAGYNNGAWDDVAAAATSGNTTSTTNDPHFPGMTLASKTYYVFYAAATVGLGDGTVTVSGPTSAVPNGSSAPFSASEKTANGFPYLGRAFTYSLDNPNAGSINSSTGLFTAGVTGAGGTVTATDTAVPTRTGTKAVSTASSRPGVGLTALYTGTLTVVQANNAINSSPVTATTTSAVTSGITTATDGSGNTVFTNSETDASQLRTTTVVTKATVAYQGLTGVYGVRTLTSVATDSNGVTLENDYGPNNGLVTTLPENDGATFTNDAGLTYKETDPGVTPGGGVTTTNVVNPDGTYTRTTNGIDSGGNPQVDTSSQKADLSGSYYIHQLATPSSAGRAFIFTPPSGSTPPTIGYYNLTATGTLGSARAQTQPGYNWLSGVTTLSTETDTISANQALDASCAPASTFTGSANGFTRVRQTIVAYDVVLGTVETKTTSSYDLAGPGTVCTVVSDVTQNFYDYSQQEGNIRLDPAQTSTPMGSVSITETLSLQSVTKPSSSARSTEAAGVRLVLPASLVTTRVDAIRHQAVTKRLLSALRKAGGNR